MLVSNLTFTNGGCCRASTGSETSKESSEAPGTETKPGQEVCSTLFMSTRTFNTTFHVSSVCLSVLVSSPPVSSSPIVFFSQDIIPSHPLPPLHTMSIHLVNFSFPPFPSSPSNLPESCMICSSSFFTYFLHSQNIFRKSLFEIESGHGKKAQLAIDVER